MENILGGGDSLHMYVSTIKFYFMLRRLLMGLASLAHEESKNHEFYSNI